MASGPVELMVIKIPGNRFRGEIVAALRDLVASGTIRVIDLLFVTKDHRGAVTSLPGVPFRLGGRRLSV